MNEITIAVQYDNDKPTVSGRELYQALLVKTPYTMWFSRMCEYGFAENIDYFTDHKNVIRDDGREMPQKQTDHYLTIDKKTGGRKKKSDKPEATGESQVSTL